MAISQSPRTGLLVPLYIYPAPGAWQPLIAAKQANPGVPVVAIVNPGSGPGTKTDPNYVAGISALRAAGIVTVAYVYTKYSTRQYEEVVGDIDAYSKLYGKVFDGLFLDEMAKTHSGYYRAVTSYAKQNGFAQVIGNSGTDVPKGYVGQTTDVLVIYEDTGSPSLSFLGGWHTSYPKETWAFIAHHVPALYPALVAQAKNHVGLLYLTDGNYHAFPPYLAQLVALLRT
jgi:hypothetical protein